MSEGTFMYFAYGSNMLLARLRARCPSAESTGAAELEGYELHWHKRSKDSSGKCGIAQKKNSCVFGVLYQIADADKQALDWAEGLGHGYEEVCVQVSVEGKSLTASTYQATDVDESLMPYSWYQALVISGAKEHGLPEDYVERLRLMTSMADPDCARHEKEMRLAQEAFQ